MAAIKGGPLAASIKADELVFRNYTGGIISRDSCGTDVNFAVLLVGYSTNQEGQIDYLRVKNSWGTDWGEGGYMRVAIEDGKGICGIQSWGIYPEASTRVPVPETFSETIRFPFV